jgi:predicted lysophospholipase L1 biosynthesis ABC-type transport system permease subunit
VLIVAGMVAGMAVMAVMVAVMVAVVVAVVVGLVRVVLRAVGIGDVGIRLPISWIHLDITITHTDVSLFTPIL